MAGKRRYLVGIRTNSLRLEVPISVKNKLLVSEDYLNFLVDLGNEHMHQNKAKIASLFQLLKDELFSIKQEPEKSDWALLTPPSLCEKVRDLLVQHNLVDSSRRNTKMDDLIAIPVLSSLDPSSASFQTLSPSFQDLILTSKLQSKAISNLPSSKKQTNKKNS